MSDNFHNPLIVQSDLTVLLEVHNNLYEQGRDFLSRFAEIEKTPEHIHTYKITSLSVWNAASSNITRDYILEGLEKYSKYPVPQNVSFFIEDTISKYGKVKLAGADQPGIYCLSVNDPFIYEQIRSDGNLKHFWIAPPSDSTFKIHLKDRGILKQELIKSGFPVEDEAGFIDGDRIDLCLKHNIFSFYPYQKEAIDIFYQKGTRKGGHGVIVLPCGSGKTIVGMGVIEKLKFKTLIITTNVVAAHQWIDELLEKTTLSIDEIGEYNGKVKNIKPVTIATYQILTYRKSKQKDFLHLGLFTDYNWGLIIYDEVHLLPAPVFRAAARIQAKRRLGLTATLVREDGREDDVFALIGPKKYDVPWKEMERKGFIARAFCHEIRIEMPDNLKMEYALANERNRFRISSENYLKEVISAQLMEKHENDQILIIGQYIDQLEKTARRFNLPLITGKTKNAEREELYGEFKKASINCLVVSKVANFAVDLPDANVVIQISGTYGSRQEEAQRLGRILRPKKKNSYFYTVVSKDTKEQDFALNRQLFLTEQGYKYHIETWAKEDFIGFKINA